MIKSVSEKVLVVDSYGWKKIQKNSLTIWFKGYLIDTNHINLITELAHFLNSKDFNLKTLSSWCKTLNGHYAIIVISPDSIFAAVDKVNTVPIFYSKNTKDFFISNNAPLIKRRLPKKAANVNSQASLELAMSGYTIGGKTIFQNILQLTAGECLLYKNNSLESVFYYTYSPWKIIDRPETLLIKDLKSVLENIITELVESIQGRQVLIPLSAGYDSRLIASGLKYFGVRDVLCFSYGVKGNFESKISKLIANKLGYKWIHIDINRKNKKIFFKSNQFKKYLTNFDSYSSIPSIQDIAEISHLKNEKIVSQDAIIINGNSGDYISGGHLFQLREFNSDYWSRFLNKHYSLWQALRTKSNDSKIIEQFDEIIQKRNIPNPTNSNDLVFLYETIEYLGRQSMYVVNQQDAYDFNQLDWRLPLWFDNFLIFWESVPFKYKIGQNLYTKVLLENNWGGVWDRVPVNKKNIQPSWIRPLRFASKVFLSPFERDVWHSFEKRFFLYWMDLTRNSVITPYHKILLDNKGYKNSFSWISKDYLEQKNIYVK